MKGDAIMYVVWAVFLAAIFVSTFLAYRSRRLNTKRLMLMNLFNAYFRDDVPAHQLGQRARQIVTPHFVGGAEFYSLAISAFQDAVGVKLAHQPHSEEQQKKLLKLLAGLKIEFGLTDLYQIEGWRAGRE